MFRQSLELGAKNIVDALNLQVKSNTVVSSLMEDCRHLISLIP